MFLKTIAFRFDESLTFEVANSPNRKIVFPLDGRRFSFSKSTVSFRRELTFGTRGRIPACYRKRPRLDFRNAKNNCFHRNEQTNEEGGPSQSQFYKYSLQSGGLRPPLWIPILHFEWGWPSMGEAPFQRSLAAQMIHPKRYRGVASTWSIRIVGAEV